MRIDLTSLAFGYSLREGASTPNWATALGQGREHKINIDPTIDEVLKGMIYSSVSLASISRTQHGISLKTEKLIRAVH